MDNFIQLRNKNRNIRGGTKPDRAVAIKVRKKNICAPPPCLVPSLARPSAHRLACSNVSPSLGALQQFFFSFLYW